MLKENLVMLRRLGGYSQEQVAEKIGISRQAYAKWETGATVPDVDKAAALARERGDSQHIEAAGKARRHHTDQHRDEQRRRCTKGQL